jgi:hypothetical protein
MVAPSRAYERSAFNWGPFSIFAGGFVSEDSVDVEVLELPVRVLTVTADPDISDALTFARHEPLCVRKGLRELRAFVNNCGKELYSDNSEPTRLTSG